MAMSRVMGIWSWTRVHTHSVMIIYGVDVRIGMFAWALAERVTAVALDV